MKIEKYSDVLFSTFSDITSLAIGRTDKRLIIQRLLDGCLVALEAEKVYLLELDGDKIVKYSKTRTDAYRGTMQSETVQDSPVLRQWVIREGNEGGKFGKGSELAFDLPFLAGGILDSRDASRVIISSPLVTEQSVFGLLVGIHGAEGESFSHEDERLMIALANQAAIAFENMLLYQKLEKEATTDGLTGVYNYRFLINSLKNEVNRCRRFRQIFSFVMIDVDNLKEFNDRLGHLSGSEALRSIAKIMTRESREIDLVSKYGGDEFAIILLRTGLEGARVLTGRILNAVEQHAFDGKQKGLLTCSAGISCFPHDGESPRDIIASADRALYQAKGSGKNKVVTTDELVDELHL